jgi:phospholipid-binding lipoprotein MlaA
MPQSRPIFSLAGLGDIVIRSTIALGFCLAIAGCASPPSDPEGRAAFEEANDPLEPLNRDTFSFNFFVDRNLIRPAALAYRWVVPPPIRSGVHNIIETLRSPALFANELLQFEFSDALDTLFRTAFNLTVGFGGFFDPADQIAHVKAHDTDFGVTLAKWGVGEGPYLVLPLFGPSNPRDTVGLIVDSFDDPLGYYIPWYGDAIRAVIEGLDKREPLIEPLDELQRTSIDFYAALRSLYRQHRQDLIHGGKGGANIPAPSISEDYAAPSKSIASSGGGSAPAHPNPPAHPAPPAQ